MVLPLMCFTILLPSSITDLCSKVDLVGVAIGVADVVAAVGLVGVDVGVGIFAAVAFWESGDGTCDD